MPGPDDRSSGSRTLPAAELNPLLNPLLAENMGRWAEVYFTSPPEKREQAVLELLRELEEKRSQQDREEEPARVSDSALAQTPAAVHARCEACGGENPASNKYCGTCGAGLGEARAYSIFRDPDSRADAHGHEYSPASRADEHSAEYEQIQSSSYERGEERYETQYDEENRNGSHPREFRRPSNGNSLSLLQLTDSDSDGSMSWEDEPEPSPPSRYYIGAVLAVILVVLGYMAWRSTQAAQNVHEASAPPPAAASEAAAAPAQAPAPAKTPVEPAAQASASDASAHTSTPENVKNPPETKSSRNQVAENSAPAAVPSSAPAENPSTPAAQPAQPPAGNGGEELAIAERYLTGAAGQSRDTAEAAKWLWRSVAKQNGPATVLLSDLYLKGDGVSKNCDQARVLLDSATRKGITGAGERLRNLRAFGCQ